MKLKHVFLLTFCILFIDQALKIYIKTNFYIGKEITVLGLDWFRLHFIENEGMAYGWKLGGIWGKLALTLFRLVAVIFGTFYIKQTILSKYHNGFIVCATLVYAGAIGNLLDSIFYGMIFENSDPFLQNVSLFISSTSFSGGYAGLLQGKVVDMLYFPIISNAQFPQWVPIWGGESFEFFRPVFNIADACISSGVITILVFQKKFFQPPAAIATDQVKDNKIQDNKDIHQGEVF